MRTGASGPASTADHRADHRRSLWADTRIFATFVVALTGFLSFFLTLGALPVWALRNGHPETVVGTVTGVLLAATVITQFVAADLMRRFSVRTLLVAGVVLMGLPAPFYLAATELWSLYGLSVVRGVGFALLTVVGAVAIPMSAPRKRQGEAVGIYGLAAAIPAVVAVPAGAALTLSGRFVVVAWAAAVPLLGVALAGRLSGERPQREPAGGSASAPASGSATRRPIWSELATLALPSTTLFLITMAGGGLITILPVQRPTGTLAALALLAFGAAAALSRWRIGHLTDRRGHAMVLPVLVGIGVVGMGVAAAGLFDDSASSTVLLLVGSAVFGVAYGAVQTVTLDMSLARVPSSMVPAASALWNAAFDGGTAAGAAVLGYLAGTTLGGPGALGVSVGSLVLVGLVTHLMRERP